MRSLPVVVVEPARRSGDDGGLVEVLVIDRRGVVDGVEDFLARGSVHPENLSQYAHAHRRKPGGGLGWVGWRRIQAARREDPQGDLSGAGMGPIIAFFACRSMNL